MSNKGEAMTPGQEKTNPPGKGGKENYYDAVSGYYDQDAGMNYEARAEVNPLLTRIREDFRQITLKYPFSNALEIGCGPGIDLQWLAQSFPERSVSGIDISTGMVELALNRLEKAGQHHVMVLQGDDSTMIKAFSPGQFDLVYVFFGALNTSANLHQAAEAIYTMLKPGSFAVLTFVNKWYLREMLVQALKLRFRTALARLRPVWGGYSLDRFLPSRCYSPGEIKKAFRVFHLIEKKGYSIFYPAWYNYRKVTRKHERIEKWWRWDQRIQTTCLWSKGEYTLFVFQKPAKD